MAVDRGSLARMPREAKRAFRLIMSVTERGILASQSMLLCEGGEVTHDAIHQYAREAQPRYLAAERARKKIILDEFCATTGYHRKSAIRLFHKSCDVAVHKQRGRPPVYRTGEIISALLLVWEASGFVCGKYLAAAMGELVDRLDACGELLLGSDVRKSLLEMSGATIDRLLRPHRPRRPGFAYGNVRVVSDLSRKIEMHTFAQLRALSVGHLEVDLVLHCGMTTSEFYLTTLVAVDTVTSWTECVPVWGKGKQRVAGAMARVMRQVPFATNGIHSDNGGEFINDTLYAYCQERGVQFTHGRPYHKNDQPRVEQRNGCLVRRLVGYGRFASHVAYQQLEAVYQLACQHANCFRPTAKLVACERRGAKVVKHYDQPQTPYRRLLSSGQLDDSLCAELRAGYEQLNPLRLQRQLAELLDQLWKVEAVDPASERAQRLRRAAAAAAKSNPISEASICPSVTL